MVTLACELWLWNFSLGILVWGLKLGNFGLVTLAWTLWFGNFSLGTLAWELRLRILRLGSFAQDLSFGIFRLGNLGLGGRGNQLTDTGGTGEGSLICLVFKKLSKNPSR